ncbi:Bug family tripartite tricarboxylate transporter substrate binding protein [Azohydromonas australica]|uniref:Bug family tripartite tricarboxylate transporter substrate binding protein n=1 Tax=Azohydromonas australica TaxID=364039 RepID=UPI00041A93AF|nr:tripartite tricarboxylate transporter substrate binding protein [Azohydromonas australica]
MKLVQTLLRAIACTALSVSVAHAADVFPSKPIRWVVPYSAGGGSDALARTVASQMSTQMGQQIIIDNRPGGAAVIGTGVVAKAPGDGYTIGSADNGPLVFNTALFKSLPYNPQKDLAPVGLMVRFPLLLVVNPSTGYASAKQLIDDMRKNPGKLSYGTAGVGSPHHIAMEMLKERAKLDAVHVAYKGAAPAIQDVVGGQLPLMVVDTAAGMPMIKAGKLKVLATFSKSRVSLLPDVPTLMELGYTDVEAVAWQGLVVPASTPAPITERLSTEMQKAISTPSVRTRLLELGLEPVGSDASAMTTQWKTDANFWPKLIRERGISLE